MGARTMTNTFHDALALLATEWFRAARRAMRIAQEAAPARLERERAQLAYATGRVSDALTALDIRLHEFVGQPYSPALPVEPVNPEDFDSEEGLFVQETIEPTILHDGRVLMRGKVVLAKGQ
jgi:hypothetical protein